MLIGPAECLARAAVVGITGCDSNPRSGHLSYKLLYVAAHVHNFAVSTGRLSILNFL